MTIVPLFRTSSVCPKASTICPSKSSIELSRSFKVSKVPLIPDWKDAVDDEKSEVSDEISDRVVYIVSIDSYNPPITPPLFEEPITTLTREGIVGCAAS